jgi:hypothetical protein
MQALLTTNTRSWTAARNAMRWDARARPALAAFTPPTAPAAVPGNIFGRNSALATRIKHHPAYAESIGRDLGIIGPERATVDPVAVQPELTLGLQAGHPNVGWTRQNMDALEIHVDRDGTGFVFLTIDTVPDYLDTAPLPPAGTAAVWRYKAIYRLGDEQTGQWSAIASITVGG